MQIADKFIITIFGASGDLTKKKLIPGLYNLFQQKLFGKNFAILGIARTIYTDKSYRQYISRETAINDPDFISRLYFISVNTTSVDDYEKIKTRLELLDQQYHTNGNILFYMSLPPSMFSAVIGGLAHTGLNNHNTTTGWRRIIVEKPFGYDLESAQKLNKELLSVFFEQQIYRIDHYLGKETVQNILVTRFSNSIFEPLWNNKYINHVQISAVEDIGIEKRGGYYDSSGALRDMVQNHLLQVFGMIAMEEPSSIDSASIRDKISEAFKALKIPDTKKMLTDVIRGQYTRSCKDEFMMAGYKQEDGIPEQSTTETYVALKAEIDNERWKGVPFFFRTGKRLRNKVSEVVIQFKPSVTRLFNNHNNEPNQLVFRLQPDEGILFRFGLKKPGAGFDITNVNMLFRYSSMVEKPIVSGYDRLLLDCLNGDSTLFSRGDAQEQSWKFITPILNFFKENPNHNLYGYKAGTWGPIEATDLIFKETGYLWRNTCRGLENECICML